MIQRRWVAIEREERGIAVWQGGGGQCAPAGAWSEPMQRWSQQVAGAETKGSGEG